MPQQIEMARIFHAMGDPTRLAVLRRLAHGQLPVGRLAEGSAMALPSFMQHLKVLETAGLIRTRKQGRSRICTLDPVTLGTASHWIEHQRLAWNFRLDNLDQLVAGRRADVGEN